MIKVKDGYAKLIGTTYQGSATQVLLSNGGDLEYSASSKASTLVQRNASQHIYATYFNSAISDEALTDIGSVYVRNTSDTFIRRISKTQFYSIIDNKFVTLDTAQTITGVKTFAAHFFLGTGASLIQNQEYSSNYTAAIKWYKGRASQGTYDPQIGQHNTGGDGTGSICILPYPTNTDPWNGTVGLFISKGVLRLDGKAVALAENYYTKTESDERYVNVTGDTMTGPLIVKAAITGTQLISTIATGTSPLKVTSTTVVTNLNSDLLDGFHETDFVRSFWTSIPGYDCSKYNSRPLISFTYSNNAPFNGGFIDVNTRGYGFYLGTAYSSNAPLYYKRHGTSNDGGMGTWQQLARITDNVASATKLQTARTINGTLFDGTANITTAYWGTARTITLSGAVTGSASVNGSQNVTITTTYQFGSIDGRYLKHIALNGGLNPVSGITTWGNSIGTVVAEWCDSSGNSAFKFKKDNPLSGKMSMLIDGTVYINEGTEAVASQAWVNAKDYIKVIAVRDTSWSNFRVNDASTIQTLRAFDVYGAPAGGPTTYGNVLEIVGISGHWQPQLWFDAYPGGSLRHRNKSYNSNNWGAWHTILDTNNYTSFIDSRYVKKSGDTMTGVLNMMSNHHPDSYSGALDIRNSNICGVNSIYTQDLAEKSDEGIHFYRDAAHVDTLWVSNGVLRFVPNRTLGSSSTTDGNVIWHAGNDGSGSGLDADLLDGVHASHIMENSGAGSARSGTSTGWFRIASSYVTDAGGISCILLLWRNYSYLNNESYTFSINVTYNGSISITQLSGVANYRAISKIRVTGNANSGAYYIDLYIGTSSNDNYYYWTTIGGFKSSNTWTANPSAGKCVKEFATVNGCKSDYGFIGNIAGNSSSATKLQTARSIWGQSFDGTRNVSGDMTNVGNITTTALNGRKIVVNGPSSNVWLHVGSGGANHGIYSGSKDAWICATDGTNTFMSIGNVGVGTTAPSYKLHVAGDIYANGGWLRTSGNVGWYNETYSGGWYQTDSEQVRVYNNKVIYNDGSRVWGIGGHNVGLKLYNGSHIGINLANGSYTWGIYSNSNGNMYIGRRNGDVNDSSGSYYHTLTTANIQSPGFYHTGIGSNNYVLLAGGSYKNLADFAKGNAGASNRGVYVTNGTVTAMTYYLNATINSGSSGKLAYYSGATAISSYTSTVGNTITPMYLNGGVPTACSMSFNGSSSQPIVLVAGRIYKSGTSWLFTGSKHSSISSVSASLSTARMTITATGGAIWGASIIQCDTDAISTSTSTLEIYGAGPNAHWFSAYCNGANLVYVREMHQRDKENHSWSSDTGGWTHIKSITIILVGFIS